MELARLLAQSYATLSDTMAEPVFSVGDVIRKLRKERRWSIRKLATESGIGRMTISEIENNRSNYQKETLDALAAAFGRSGPELEAMVTPKPATGRADDLPPEWVAFTRKVMHLNRLGQGALHMMLLALQEVGAVRSGPPPHDPADEKPEQPSQP